LKSEEKKQLKREVLLKAALEEFSIKSFDDASLNDILKKAKVSKGAFYYSFQDKRDLYVQLFAEVIKAKADFFGKILLEKSFDIEEGDNEMTKAFKQAMIQPDQMNVFDFIRGLAMQGISFLKAYPKYYQFTAMYTKESESFRKTIEGEQALDAKSFLRAMIKKAYENGDIDKRYSLEFAEKVLTYALTNYLDIVGFTDISNMEKAFDELRLFYAFLERGFSPLDHES